MYRTVTVERLRKDFNPSIKGSPHHFCQSQELWPTLTSTKTWKFGSSPTLFGISSLPPLSPKVYSSKCSHFCLSYISHSGGQNCDVWLQRQGEIAFQEHYEAHLEIEWGLRILRRDKTWPDTADSFKRNSVHRLWKLKDVFWLIHYF